MRSSTFTRRFARLAAIALLVIFALVYVAAKVHFFRAFDPNNLSGYLVGHWPFWVVMAALLSLVLIFERLASTEPDVTSPHKSENASQR